MSYNRENYLRLRGEFEARHRERVSAAELRRAELQKKLPELYRIDRELAEIGVRIYGEITAPTAQPRPLDERLADLRRENERLQQERAELLRAHGYSSDETDPHFDCPVCRDYGTVGDRICECLRHALVEDGYRSAGIAQLVRTQTFDTFRPDLYPEAEREKMSRVLSFCRNYAETFVAEGAKSLLFRGETGLGKTHLSTSIASVVIGRGFDVLYDTAQNIFGDFEAEHFRTGAPVRAGSTARYLDAELLIIDDLGTELTNSFTVSCLYNIVNARICSGRATIINTNLGWDALRSRYTDRVASRLLGEYLPVEFAGRDIRREKLRN